MKKIMKKTKLYISPFGGSRVNSSLVTVELLIKQLENKAKHEVLLASPQLEPLIKLIQDGRVDEAIVIIRQALAARLNSLTSQRNIWSLVA